MTSSHCIKMNYYSSYVVWTCCVMLSCFHIVAGHQTHFQVCPMSLILFMIFVDRISFQGEREHLVWGPPNSFCVFCRWSGSNSFMRLLTSAESELAGTFKSEAVVLCWKWWFALFGLRVSYCPKWKSLSVLGSCAWVRVKCSKRLMTDLCNGRSNAGSVQP